MVLSAARWNPERAFARINHPEPEVRV